MADSGATPVANGPEAASGDGGDKMRQENQLLLKKLHDVVARYRQLQQQHQTLVAEMDKQRGGNSAAAAGDAEHAANAEATAQELAVKKLEAEKHELIDKLKHVVGTCRVMQKQLQEVKEENEILKSPPKQGEHDSGDFARAVRVRKLEQELALKDEEKEGLVAKLQEVVARYHTLQMQLEEKIGEHDAATSKVAALEWELKSQQDAQKQSQVLSEQIIREEARSAVLKEENERLKEQLIAILDDKQQREQQDHEHIEQLEHENIALSTEVSENAQNYATELANVTTQLAALCQHKQESDVQRMVEDIRQQFVRADDQVTHVAELQQSLATISEELAIANMEISRANTRFETYESSIHGLEETLQLRHAENERITANLQQLQATMRSQDAEFLSEPADETIESSVKVNGLQRELDIALSRLHESETELSSLKEENLRMIFQVAKTADGVVKLKQDHDTLQGEHSEKATEMDTLLSQLKSLSSTNKQLEKQLQAKDETIREQLDALLSEKQALEQQSATLNEEIAQILRKKNSFEKKLADAMNENDALEERIHELHSEMENRSSDQSVEDLRSSLVQAKVEYEEQHRKLSVLERKLSDVSHKNNVQAMNAAALDAERKEFQSALIELIDMEKKLQTAYETQQALEVTLQERLEAKTALEDKLHDGQQRLIVMEEELEHKIEANRLLEERLKLVEDEKENLLKELSQIESKLALTEGLLEEKSIEFEAMSTTTEMLKTDRNRLFEEIARLQEKIADSEEYKLQIASSQDAANQELEEQLTELADRVAQVETEKIEMKRELEIHLRTLEDEMDHFTARQQLVEEEKDSLAGTVSSLTASVEELERNAMTMEEQNATLTAELESAHASFTERIDEMELQVEQTTKEINMILQEKQDLMQAKLTLEDRLVKVEAEKSVLDQRLIDSNASLQNEVERLQMCLEDVEGERNAVKRKFSESTVEYNDHISELKLELADLAELLQQPHEEEQLLPAPEQSETRSLKQIVIDLRSQLKEILLVTEQSRLQLMKEVEDLQEEKKLLSRDSDALAASVSELQSKLQIEQESSQERLHSMIQELDELREQLALLSAENDANAKGKDQLQRDFEASCGSIRELEEKQSALLSELESNQNESQQSMLQLEEMKKNLDEKELVWNGERAVLEDEISRLVASNEANLSQSEENALLLAKYHALEETTQSQLEKLTLECSRVEELSKTLGGEKSVLCVEKESLSNEIKLLQAQLTEQQANSEATDKLSKIQEEHDHANQVLKNVFQKLKNSKVKNEALANEKNVLEETMTETNALVTELKSKYQATEADLSAAREHAKALETELESVNAASQTKVDEVEELSAQCAKLSSEKEALAEEVASTSQSLEEAQQNLAEAESARVVLVEQLEEVKATVAAMEEQHASAVQGHVESHSNAISRLEETLQATEADLSAAREHAKALETELESVNVAYQSRIDSAVSEVAANLAVVEQNVVEKTAVIDLLRGDIGKLQSEIEMKDEDRASLLISKDEAISKLKEKLEEVFTSYKRLKEHARSLKDRLTTQISETASLKEENDNVKAANVQRNEELNAAKQELSLSLDQLRVVSQEMDELRAGMAQLQNDRDAQVQRMESQALAYEETMTSMKQKLQTAVEKHGESMSAALRAREEEFTTKIATLEKSQALLMATVGESEAECQNALDKMREVSTRYHALEVTHQELKETFESSKRIQDAALQDAQSQLETANVTIHDLRETVQTIGGAHEGTISKLEHEVSHLTGQLEVETEAANAARTALETYKKRAHTALKKANSESKTNLKKSSVEMVQLEQQVLESSARVSSLELELAEAKHQIAEMHESSEVLAQAARETVESEMRSQETAWKAQVEAMTLELVQLRNDSQAKEKLEDEVKQLRITNEALAHEISALKLDLQRTSDSERETMKANLAEIAQLTKQLEATRTDLAIANSTISTTAAAASPDNGQAFSRSMASSHENTTTQSASLSTTEQEDKPTSASASSSSGSSSGVDNQILNLARLQALREEDAIKMQRQTAEIQSQASQYQQQYEDILVKFKRQKKQLEELSQPSSDQLNTEYLKNIVIKYIASHNPNEKEHLVPVIATLLQFTPQDMQSINQAQQKALEESSGLLSGVFSLFGAAPAPPAPKPLAMPQHIAATLPTKSNNHSSPADSDPDEEETLNPFAS